MNKRQRKKYKTQAQRPTLQEAWDVIAEELVVQNASVCSFVDHNSIDGHSSRKVRLHCIDREIANSTKTVEEIKNELRHK